MVYHYNYYIRFYKIINIIIIKIMNYEKVKEIKKFYLESEKNDKLIGLFLEKFNTLEQYEKEVLISSMLDEYEYFINDDDVNNTEYNKFLFNFMCNEELKVIERKILSLIKDDEMTPEIRQ